MASVAKEGMRNPVFQQNCEQSAVVIIMPLNKHGFLIVHSLKFIQKL